MPAMTEAAQVGKRQEILDDVFNIQPEATPVLSLLKKGAVPNQMLATWQAEVYPDIASTPAVDGDPVTSYERVDRHLLQSYGHFFRRSWAVTKLAQLTNIAGVGKNEAARQLKAAMLLLKRAMEQKILSEDDTQADNGTVGFGMRGMGSWLSTSAQSVLPVPAAIRPASGTIYTGALSSLTETLFRGCLEAAYTARKSPLKLLGIVGIDLKAIIDDWTNVYPVASTTSQPRTVYRVEGNQSLINNVTMVKFSVGEASLVLSEFVARDTSDGAVTATSRKKGYFVDTSMWDIGYMEKPANTNLSPDGSGIRGYIDAVAVLRCYNPLGQVHIKSAS
jgi:hypothetical protein